MHLNLQQSPAVVSSSSGRGKNPETLSAILRGPVMAWHCEFLPLSFLPFFIVSYFVGSEAAVPQAGQSWRWSPAALYLYNPPAQFSVESGDTQVS